MAHIVEKSSFYWTFFIVWEQNYILFLLISFEICNYTVTKMTTNGKYYVILL